MKKKYISINILENLINQKKSLRINNLCRKAIYKMINEQKRNNIDEFNKNRLYLLDQNDSLYKFIK